MESGRPPVTQILTLSFFTAMVLTSPTSFLRSSIISIICVFTKWQDVGQRTVVTSYGAASFVKAD